MNQRLMAANRSLSKYNLLIGIENVAFTECNKYYVSFAHPSDCRRFKSVHGPVIVSAKLTSMYVALTNVRLITSLMTTDSLTFE